MTKITFIMKGKGTWIELDTTVCPKIAQAAVVCKYGQINNPDASKQLEDFIFSQQAGEILKQNGFDVP